MKKWICVLILFLLFYQKGDAQYMTRAREFYEEMLQEGDANTYNIYLLFKNGDYEEVVKTQKTLVDNCNEDLCLDESLYLINAFLGLEKKDSAIIYTQLLSDKIRNNEDKMYLSKMNAIWEFFMVNMVALDLEIQSMLKAGFKDYFFRKKYPYESIGIQLFDYYYKDQYLTKLRYFNLSEAKDSADIFQADSLFYKAREGDFEGILALYDNHPWFYSEQEIGAVRSTQDLLFFHLVDPSNFETTIGPILQNSYEKDLINGDAMVRFLERLITFREHNNSMEFRQQITDSLCNIYHCEGIYKFSKENK